MIQKGLTFELCGLDFKELSYLPYVFLGLLPSIIWLLFYLREDCHPEPKRMVMRVFLLGMLSAAPAAGIQYLFSLSFKAVVIPVSVFLPVVIIGFAAVEEIFKYLVVRFKVLKNREFDEPIDAMVYLIIAALGFAASENILLLFSNFNDPGVNSLMLAAGRFVGATFLHTLASGILGYFLALAIYKKSGGLILAGLAFAIIFHGFYNFGISYLNKFPLFALAYLILILGLMATAVILLFRDLKKIPSVCD